MFVLEGGIHWLPGAVIPLRPTIGCVLVRVTVVAGVNIAVLRLHGAASVAIDAGVASALLPRWKTETHPTDPLLLLPLAVFTVWLGPLKVLEPHREYGFAFWFVVPVTPVRGL